MTGSTTRLCSMYSRPWSILECSLFIVAEPLERSSYVNARKYQARILVEGTRFPGIFNCLSKDTRTMIKAFCRSSKTAWNLDILWITCLNYQCPKNTWTWTIAIVQHCSRRSRAMINPLIIVPEWLRTLALRPLNSPPAHLR
jgi:hypothetical protein